MTIDYGTDLSCVDDLEDDMSEVSGLLTLAQSCVRRLTTPRGRLIGEPDYGDDVHAFLHKGMTADEIAGIPARIRQELLKEEGVFAVDVIATFSGQSISVDIRITTDAGSFTIVLSVSEAQKLLATATIDGVLLEMVNEAEAA